MSKPKLTPWYSKYVNPVRKGVYEIDGFYPPWFRYFDGQRWHVGARTPRLAYLEYATNSGFSASRDPWRGLTEKAK